MGGAEGREGHVAHQVATVGCLHWRVGELLGDRGKETGLISVSLSL